MPLDVGGPTVPPMLPTSVEPLAKKKITARQPYWVNSVEETPVVDWRGVGLLMWRSGRRVGPGRGRGVARERAVRERRRMDFILELKGGRAGDGVCPGGLVGSKLAGWLEVSV